MNSLVLDVGCGPGRVLGFLARREIRCIGIDRSYVSISAGRLGRYGRPGVVADNLSLPLADATADTIISDGVIHHTEDPAAAFLENLRILKPAGQLYLAVYKPSGRYPRLYQVLQANKFELAYGDLGQSLLSFSSPKCHTSYCTLSGREAADVEWGAELVL